MDTMFCPADTWVGTPDQFSRHDVYPWVASLPKNKKIYCCFWHNWNTNVNNVLPENYDYYLISYHTENINLSWLQNQRQAVDGKFIVLIPGQSYNYQMPNTEFVSYIDWHRDIQKIIEWHGFHQYHIPKKYKFSAICNRTTQSKIWITTKLLESAKEQSFILHNPSFLQEKNVHSWNLTGNPTLDNLTEIYKIKYKNLLLSDGFDQKDNYQRFNSNPWQPAYTESALHFTNGSFHYSKMVDNDIEYIYPGPDIDEKTLKCLVAGVPFIACGQFEIYKILSDLGLVFDYGFDLSWDNDPGNISRFASICNLVDQLCHYTIDDIVSITSRATLHNQEFVCKGEFYHVCEQHKKQAIEKIISIIEY